MQVTDHLKNLPPSFGDNFEYYYRRGNKFFFRTPNKTYYISFVCSPKVAKTMQQQLVKGKVYSTAAK